MTAPNLALARLMSRVLAELRARGAEVPEPPPYRKGHTDYAPMSPRGRYWIADPERGVNVPDPRDDGWGPVLVMAAKRSGVAYMLGAEVRRGGWRAVGHTDEGVDICWPKPGGELSPTMTEAVTRALAAALGVE